jgi:hypothetical protein
MHVSMSENSQLCVRLCLGTCAPIKHVVFVVENREPHVDGNSDSIVIMGTPGTDLKKIQW